MNKQIGGRDDIAYLLNLSVQRIYQLDKAGIIVKNSYNKYDLVKSNWGYIQYLSKLAGQGGETLTSERTRETKHRADILARESSKQAGDLLEKEVVIGLWERHIMDCRAKLLSLPTKISPVAYASKSLSEIKAATESLVNEALQELASIDVKQYTAELKKEKPDEATDTPKSKVKKKRVKAK